MYRTATELQDCNLRRCRVIVEGSHCAEMVPIFFLAGQNRRTDVAQERERGACGLWLAPPQPTLTLSLSLSCRGATDDMARRRSSHPIPPIQSTLGEWSFFKSTLPFNRSHPMHHRLIVLEPDDSFPGLTRASLVPCANAQRPFAQQSRGTMTLSRPVMRKVLASAIA